MLQKLSPVTIATVGLLLFSAKVTQAAAQATVTPQAATYANVFTPDHLQQLTQDLTPSSSEAFFRQGREQIEQEIQRLQQRRGANQRILNLDLRLVPLTKPEKM